MITCSICNSENPDSASVCQTCGVALADNNGATDEALPVGTVLRGGQFTVGRVLGKGGFGITYLGSDTQTRRTVAIKELFPFGSSRRGHTVVPRGFSGGEYKEASRRFLDEAHTLLRFHNPQIVDVHTAFEENNTAYMVMEYLQGKTLLELVTEQRALSEARAIEYTVQVGSALDAIHQASLLHRDIKPENVIVTDAGRVVLFDFGTARAFSGGQTSRMTAQLTPGYAPLEQYGRNARFGRYTDIYALGAMLYHLLTGEMPAPATDRAGGETLRPPDDVNPFVSQSTSKAVMWAMEMKIDARPQSVEEFLAALRPPLRSTIVAAHSTPAEPETKPPPLAPVPPRSTPVSPSTPQTALATTSPPATLTVAENVEQVRVSRSTVQWPKKCACCGGNSDTLFMIQAPLNESAPYQGWTPALDVRQWYAPYCTGCLHHIEASRDAAHTGRWGLGLSLSLLFGLGVVGQIPLNIVGATLVTGFCWPYQRFAMKGAVQAMQPTCSCMQPAVNFGGWDEHGIIFSFHSAAYANEFRQLNAQILSTQPIPKPPSK